MSASKRSRRLPVPDKAFRRLADIDISRDICGRGYKLVVLDIDGTVKNRVLRKAPADTVAWIRECRERGLFLCFVSNDRRRRHIEFTDELDLPIVDAAHKPSPAAIEAILVEYEVDASRAVIIGNNPFTDVLCGKRAGIGTYLVRSIETTRNRLAAKPGRKKRRMRQR